MTPPAETWQHRDDPRRQVVVISRPTPQTVRLRKRTGLKHAFIWHADWLASEWQRVPEMPATAPV